MLRTHIPDNSGCEEKRFYLLSMECEVGGSFVLHELHHAEVSFLYSHFAENCQDEWVLSFVECTFCIYCYNHVIFILSFVYAVSCSLCADIVPSLYAQNKSHFLMCYLIQFSKIVLRILASVVIRDIGL